MRSQGSRSRLLRHVLVVVPLDNHRLPSVRNQNLQPMALRPTSRQPRKIRLQQPLPLTHILPHRSRLALQQFPPHLDFPLHRGVGGFRLAFVAAQQKRQVCPHLVCQHLHLFHVHREQGVALCVATVSCVGDCSCSFAVVSVWES